MARNLITRTISGTKVEAKVINPQTGLVATKTIVLEKVITDASKLSKEVTKQLDPETEVLVSVVSSEKIDKLFGITVADFMAHAVELDPKTRTQLN